MFILQTAQEHPKMTEAMALNMGILPRSKNTVKPEDFFPVLKSKIVNGKVVLDCPLLGFAGYEIWSDDTGNLDFVNGRISVGRLWTDETPLPPDLTSQTRSYRVRMLQKGNKPVGHLSNIVVETVLRDPMGA